MMETTWKILSPELLIFLSVLGLYISLRRSSFLSLKPVEGLAAYLPPQEEDLQVMEKTNQPERENSQGQKNKYDKKRLPKKCKFPYRTIDINQNMLQHCQEFFYEYDFFFMLCMLIIAQFVITIAAKLIFPAHISTNLVFYLMGLTLSMGAMHLLKGKLNCKCADETKIEFLVAIKAFIAVFILLYQYGSALFFDFDLKKEHEASLARCNQIFNFMGLSLELPPEYTYFLMSLMASAISFTTVQLNVSFAYYMFTLTRPSMSMRMSETPDNYKLYKKLLYIMYGNILLPVLVCLSFLSPLSQQLLVPDYMSEDVFKFVRITLIMLTLMLRMLSFREELQFGLNESYILIQKFVQLKNQQLFRYIQLRVKENFLNTWVIVFKHFCNVLLPLLLFLAYLNRYIAFTLVDSEASWEFDLSLLQKNALKAQEEERQYDLFADQDSIRQIFSEVSSKGMLKFELQEGVLQFAIFWYFFSQIFVFSFAFLYYRKYLDK